MPATDRRAVLAGLGSVALGSIAGCSTNESADPPAGSLRFVNDDDLPHSITVRVTDIGTDLGDDTYSVTGDTTAPPSQRALTASTTLEPGTSETYEVVFTEAAWYALQFTVDGREPADDRGRVVFNPAPDDEPTGRVVIGNVTSNGEFSWAVSATDDLSSFGR